MANLKDLVGIDADQLFGGTVGVVQGALGFAAGLAADSGLRPA